MLIVGTAVTAKLLFGGVSISVTGVTGTLYVKKKFRYFYSFLLDKASDEPPQSTRFNRSQFQKTPFIVPTAIESHTHGDSAAKRNAATVFARDVGARLGMDTYSYQRSATEGRNGHAGSRLYYWAKDLDSQPRDFAPPENSLISYVDVDYYLDMNTILTENFCPHVLYTLQPTRACCSEGEFSMYWRDDNTIVYQVSGGGEYSHELYDWSHDHVMVVKRNWFGIPCAAAVYLIDRRKVDEFHVLVMLTPMRRWRGMLRTALARFLHSKPLERFQPVQNGFVRFRLQTKEGMQVTTSRVGATHSVVVPSHVDESIAAQARYTSKLTLANVMSWLKHIENDEEKKRAATVLYDYYRTENRLPLLTTYPVDEAVRSYDFDVEAPEEVKPSMVAFMQPLINEAFVPTTSQSNLDRAHKGRVDDVAWKKTFKPRFHVANAVREFLDHVALGNQGLDPMPLEEVYSRQNRPSQRRIIDESIQDDKKTLKAFIKKEAYEKPKDPRIITTDTPKHKTRFAQFMYVVMDYLKAHLRFYMPGKTPEEVATRIADIAEPATNIVNADISRMDGRTTSYIHEAFEILIKRLFKPCYAEELSDLQAKATQREVALNGRDDAYLKYFSYWIILSGGMGTSAFGTFANACGIYVGLRTFRHSNGTYMCSEACWTHMQNKTVVMGDDACVADAPVQAIRLGAKAIGLKSEATSVKRGDLGVEFLSRAYSPNVWYGDNNSMTLPSRQLSKLHVTVNIPATPIEKLQEKARGYLCSDRETPILGDFCRKVEELSGGKLFAMDKTAEIARWQSDLSEDVQFPNSYAEWMDDVVERDLPGFNINAFHEHLTGIESLDDLLVMPCFQDIKPVVTKHPVKVDGIIHGEQEVGKAKPRSNGRNVVARRGAKPLHLKGKKRA